MQRAATPPAEPAAEGGPPAPVPGRGRPLAEAGLRRLRAWRLLQFSAVAAFMGYGGLIALVLAGKLTFGRAGTVALLSLASWFFLFLWLPIAERTWGRGPVEGRAGLPAALETVAVGCVVLVHLLMAIIVFYAARS